jgi:hypothetical protein
MPTPPGLWKTTGRAVDDASTVFAGVSQFDSGTSGPRTAILPRLSRGRQMEEVLKILLMMLFCFTAFTIVVVIAMYAGPMP